MWVGLIFWMKAIKKCQKTPITSLFNCNSFLQNDVQWKVFQNPGKGVHLSGIGHEKNKLFAVAVHQENQTSGGLTFPKCYYTLQNSQDSE